MKKTMFLLVSLMVLSLLTSCGGGEKQGQDLGQEGGSIAKPLDSEPKKDQEEGEDNENLKKIGVIQIVEHLSLDMIRESALNELENLGYKDGENCIIDYQNAGGDISILNTIVNGFAGDKKDVIIAIATPSAQAAAKLSDTSPIVFSAVTDPVAAGLVESLDKTSANITGTSDAVAVEKILELALKIIPDAKTMGIIYNTSEANSVTNIAKAKAFAKEKDLKLIEQGIANSSEVKQAGAILAEKTDFIFSPNDNTVASAMAALASVQLSSGVPIIVGADSMVMDGGLATYGINYEELGRESAKMVDKILRGESTANIPVKVFDQDLNIYVNETIASQLGIEIPEEILQDEKYIGIK